MVGLIWQIFLLQYVPQSCESFFLHVFFFHLLCCVCVIVQDIGKMLTLAADTIQELSRASPSSEVVEYKTKDFLKTVEVI